MKAIFAVIAFVIATAIGPNPVEATLSNCRNSNYTDINGRVVGQTICLNGSGRYKNITFFKHGLIIKRIVASYWSTVGNVSRVMGPVGSTVVTVTYITQG